MEGAAGDGAEPRFIMSRTSLDEAMADRAGGGQSGGRSGLSVEVRLRLKVVRQSDGEVRVDQVWVVDCGLWAMAVMSSGTALPGLGPRTSDLSPSNQSG